MSKARRCPACGWEGEPETPADGLALCARCGEALGDGGDALFAPRRYRLARLPGLALGWPRRIQDETGAELAHVKRARPGLRRLFALLAGALTLSAGLFGLYLVGEGWGWIGQALVYVAGLPLLLLALRVTARLSPGPSLIVVQSGRDPRLLFRVRTVREEGARCLIEVDDPQGASLGELSLDRPRAQARPYAALADHVRISPRGGEPLRARRVSRLRPGTVYEDPRGQVVATHGLSGGLAHDDLQLAPTAEIDARLLLAAALVSPP